MAYIETWLNCDLMKPAPVLYPEGRLFSDDNNGNLIGVNVTKDGEAVAMSGSVTGYCILANGTVEPVAGTIIGNKATVILPSGAYAVPGLITIIVKWIQNTDITTIGAVISTVFGMGGVISPAESTIDDWTDAIEAAIDVVEGNSVRYDITQSLTTEQKTRAKNNIGAIPSAVSISGDDYKIILP